MTGPLSFRLALAVFAAMAVGVTVRAETHKPRVLVFSHTTGWRHDSIEPARDAIKALAARDGYETVASEDPSVFSEGGLAGFDAVLFLSSTTGMPKDGAEEPMWLLGDKRDALQAFVKGGGAVIGVHAAADSHYGWPWYGRMIGGYFKRHPEGTPEGALKVVDACHPATLALPAEFRRADEWYFFSDVNPETTTLVTLDPASIGEAESAPVPVAWFHEFEGARVFYTAMGHTKESYAEPLFLQHLSGGIRWALKLEEAPASCRDAR
ncbi:MAG: ThuA domain-containing protein [Amphiplicatus sp.]